MSVRINYSILKIPFSAILRIPSSGIFVPSTQDTIDTYPRPRTHSQFSVWLDSQSYFRVFRIAAISKNGVKAAGVSFFKCRHATGNRMTKGMV